MIDTTTHLLPDEADLLPSTNVIENQGPFGTCTGQGVVKVLETESARLHDAYPNIPTLALSVLYNYFWSGNFEGRIGQEGRSPEDAFIAAMIKAVCLESSWGYDASKLDVQPPVSCDLEAQKVKIISYCSLMGDTADKTLSTIQHAICQGRPVGISITLTEDFRTQWRLQNNWRTFSWDARPSATNPIIGSHEVVAMGYSNKAGRLLIQNSWDRECDGGFFGYPYELLEDRFWGMTTAFCSVYDTIGHIALPTYLPIQYDAIRQAGIRGTVSTKLQEIAALARQHSVTGDEMDAAMPWPAGRASELLHI